MSHPTLSRRKQIVFAGVLVGSSVLVAFGVLELGLRILGLGYASVMLTPDPLVHHLYRKNTTFLRSDPAGIFHQGHPVRIGADGFVANPQPQNTDRPDDEATMRVAVLGDSFVEGHYQPYPISFVGQLERAAVAGVRLRNFGVSSYSPVLYWALWLHHVARFRPTHVVMLLYSNDVASDVEYEAQALRDAQGVVRAVPGPEPSLLREVAVRSYVCRLARKWWLTAQWRARHAKDANTIEVDGLLEENPDPTPLSKSYVLRVAKQVLAQGGRFALSVVPSKVRVQQPVPSDASPEFSDKWRTWAASEDIEFIDLVPAFTSAARRGERLFLHGDIHFTNQGTRIAAEQVAAYFPELFSTDAESDRGIRPRVDFATAESDRAESAESDRE